MKRKMLSILLLVGIVAFAGSAMAYTITDPSNDAIGTAFESYGMNVGFSGGFLNVDLYTDYTGSLTVGQWPTKYADLGIDLDQDGIFEYGFTLKSYKGTDHGGSLDTLSGSLYKNVSAWWTSDDHEANDATGGPYSFNHDFDVTVKAGELVNTYGFSVDSNHTISLAIALGDLGDLGSAIDLKWGTATCANDIVQGTAPVPVPPSILLLGSGLIGFVGIGRRKIFKG